jgi:hypothetical protein
MCNEEKLLELTRKLYKPKKASNKILNRLWGKHNIDDLACKRGKFLLR